MITYPIASTIVEWLLTNLPVWLAIPVSAMPLIVLIFFGIRNDLIVKRQSKKPLEDDNRKMRRF